MLMSSSPTASSLSTPDRIRGDVCALSPQAQVMRIFEAEDVTARVVG